MSVGGEIVSDGQVGAWAGLRAAIRRLRETGPDEGPYAWMAAAASLDAELAVVEARIGRLVRFKEAVDGVAELGCLDFRHVETFSADYARVVEFDAARAAITEEDLS